MSNPMTKEEAAKFAKNFSEHKAPQESVSPCPNCEYNRKRAQLWREEAYKQAGHPLPERGWVGLTDEDQSFVYDQVKQIVGGKPFWVKFADAIEAKLKEMNNG